MTELPVDFDAALRAWLEAEAELTALTGTRIYAGVKLPEGYKPADGSALLFTQRPSGEDYSRKVLYASYQFLCYGAGQEQDAEAAARTLARTLCGLLAAARPNSAFMSANMETSPALLEDPDTGWPYTVTFWNMIYHQFTS